MLFPPGNASYLDGGVHQQEVGKRVAEDRKRLPRRGFV